MFHLAEINVATMRWQLDDPRMADFVSQLDVINALAEAAPGFVWRLKDENGAATTIRVYENPLILVNMSVWTSIDALFNFTYRTKHLEVWKRRGEWFEQPGAPQTALWWIPEGSIPTPEAGRERLERLLQHGPSVAAFTFRNQFAQPGLLAGN